MTSWLWARHGGWFAIWPSRWAIAGAINHEALSREILAGSDAWQDCDRTTAASRLRAGFEVLTQARERFYPVDAYLIDLCLLDPAMSAGVLARSARLSRRTDVSGPGAGHREPGQAGLRRHGTAPPGNHRGMDRHWRRHLHRSRRPGAPLGINPLAVPPRGEVYREHLDERSVETYARRRFGLYTQLPQIAKRFGFRFALHLGFDAGRFPIRPEAKRLWESPDGTSLETLLRPPLAADRPSQGQMLPWRLATTMKNDHVATLPLVHWPAPVASWYVDLRRGATYSPVLGRWVTLNDYFHLTDRPYETFRPDPDSYQSPFLTQAASKREDEPISRLARHHRLRARFQALEFVRAAVQVIASAATGTPASAEIAADAEALSTVETSIETGRHGDAGVALDRHEALWTERLARGVVPVNAGTSAPVRPGYLVFNPLGVPRRVAVTLPDAATDLRPEGPLRAAQFTDRGVCAVVDAPAFGFAWVPRQAKPEQAATTPGGLSAGYTLKNETIEVEIDEATGGIRGVMAVGESTARLGQQLVISGLGESGGKAVIGQMKAERFEIEYAGPALVQATAAGIACRSRLGAAPGPLHPALSLVDGPAGAGNCRHTFRDRSVMAPPRRGGRPLDSFRRLPVGLARPDLDGAADRSARSRGHRD